MTMSGLRAPSDVLGVAPGATREQLRSAYRERARVLHPDRHVRPDGTVPEAVNAAFCELSEAFRTSLAALSTSGAAIPAQRPAQRPAARSPQTTARRATSRTEDPMLALLTLPQYCAEPWPEEALAAWALTVVPAARAQLVPARCLAVGAGARGFREVVPATSHALLSLTLRTNELPSGLRDAQIAAAYSALEASLPDAVVGRLPARTSVTTGAGSSRSAVVLGSLAAVLALVVIYAAQITRLVS
jgi:hypothetical protein